MTKKIKTADLPATVGLVQSVRAELKEAIHGTELCIESSEARLRSEMVSMEGRLDARISEVKADVSILKTDVSILKADVAMVRIDISEVKEMVHQQTISFTPSMAKKIYRYKK